MTSNRVDELIAINVNMTTHLGCLEKGQSAIIASVETGSAYANKLLMLGLTPGTLVRVVRAAPLGDPIQVNIRGYNLSLRRDEAHVVNLELVSE